MTPRWSYRVLAIVALLLGLGAAAAALWTGATIAQLRADAQAKAAAAEGVVDVGFALRTALNDAAAQRADGREVSLQRARTQGVPLPDLVQARDTGDPTLSATGEVVVARYGGPQPPADVATRRREIAGVVVVPVPLSSILSDIARDHGGIAVLGPEQPVAQAPTAVPPDAVSYSVDLPPTLVSGWTVVTWSPAPGIPLGAWTIASFSAMAGLGATTLVTRRARRVSRRAAAQERRRSQQETLTGLAAVAQRSLDLAEVLPAVATQLSDELGLRGLRLTGPSAQADRSVFVVGHVAPSAPESPHVVSLGAGESLSILMARGGRTVARMTVTAGRPLDEHDLSTLRETADVLTSALANAEAFAQQRELVQRLREVDDLKTVFLATASHELRTPVGIISGFARLLADNATTFTIDQIATYAGRVDANARQLSDLVENLLDFSRLERGVHARTEHQVLDLGACVTTILDQHADLASDHQLLCHAPPGHLVLGAAHAVERVVTNLVGNAGKYAPAGTTIRVRVQLSGDDRVEIVVDDEGPGVPAGERDQVFSRFFRGRGDAVTNTRGAGLGLAIVQEFAASMSGVVSVREAPTGGARFVVSYPVAEPDATPSDPGRPAPRALAEEPAEEGASDDTS